MSDYKPITGELRGAWIGQDVDTWMFDKELFGNLCDAIDVIHAQLEKENAALKAEFDRVTGEQEEHAHTRGESITDELREYASGCTPNARERITAIADRIDAEHEAMLVDARKTVYQGYIELPKDADGEVWHVGDFVVGEVNPRNPKAIESMIWYGPDSGWQLEMDTIIYTSPDRTRHYHAPTVEDVLREFALKVAGEECMTMRTGVVEEYAAKLRLVNDEE